MVSAIYLGLMGLVLFKISIETIKGRRKHQISLGTGQENQIEGVVAAHSNFVAYAPFLVLLLFIHEFAFQTPKVLLHVFGIVCVLGRWLHFKGMTAEKMDFKQRVVGMHMTLWPLLIMSISAIVHALINS